MALRLKQEEIGELNVRKDLAEKKLATTIHESEISVEKLQVGCNTRQTRQLH